MVLKVYFYYVNGGRAFSSETSEDFFQATWPDIPHVGDPHSHRCKNFKFFCYLLLANKIRGDAARHAMGGKFSIVVSECQRGMFRYRVGGHGSLWR